MKKLYNIIAEEEQEDIYNYIKTKYLNSVYSSAATSDEETINNINYVLSDFNLIHNELNLLNNIRQETLLKTDQLINFESDDITNQLRKLEVIQGNIINKDRIIEEININIDNQNQNIYFLTTIIILGIILVCLIILTGKSVIDYKKFKLILMILLLIFFILFIYTYNIFYFKTSISYLFDRGVLRLGNELKQWNEKVVDDMETALYGTESDWIQNNCQCPASTTTTTTPQYSNSANKTYPEQPGYFYYDGSAPSQLLVPYPPQVNQEDNNESIVWVDYSPDGNREYNPTISYTNTNYYNYNDKLYPVVKLNKSQDSKSVTPTTIDYRNLNSNLVYEETLTVNL